MHSSTFRTETHRVPYCYFAQISPDKKKSMEKQRTFLFQTFIHNTSTVNNLWGFFLLTHCMFSVFTLNHTFQILWQFLESFHFKYPCICRKKKTPQVVHSWSVVNKGVKEKCPLFFHWFFFVWRDLGEITIGNPVGLCGKCAWMHGGGGVLLSSLDEVQMSPTRRWELHRWIRIPKDDWWRPVGGCGSPSSLEDHPDILVGAQNRYGVDGAGIHVCHPVKTTYNLTEIS